MDASRHIGSLIISSINALNRIKKYLSLFQAELESQGPKYSYFP